jgi:hypothetical protein
LFKNNSPTRRKKVSEKEINLSKTKFVFLGSLALLVVSLVAWLVNLGSSPAIILAWLGSH